jgi:DNA-binding PadR family transcriptional regulator
MDTELVKGTLSLLILSLLTRTSMYGYEIAATVHRDTDGRSPGARDRCIRAFTKCRPTA